MKLNPYIKIILITLIFTIFSYLIEIYNKTSINHLNRCNNIGLFVFRYIHYLFLFYFSCFLLFFNYKKIDAIIFLVTSILMTYSWIFFECCIVSYYELKCYNVNHHDYLTTFHPCLFVIFKEYQSYPLIISGVLMFLTYFYILFKNKIIPYIYKLFFGIIFLYLFIDNIKKTRYYNTTLKYPRNKNHKLYKYFTFI
jgi:hypothetical protein